MTQTELKSEGDAAGGTRAAAHAPRRLGGWELLDLAAVGSWSQIYRARPARASVDRPAAYAVKTLRPQYQDDPRAVALMAREAVAGRCVSHPHLIPVLEASISRPPRYLVMPWLEGTTLQTQLKGPPLPPIAYDGIGEGWNEGICDQRPGATAGLSSAASSTIGQANRGGRASLDVPRALWIARQTAQALQALDDQGWTHGDVKPSNIFLSPQGHVTLLDLGFARRHEQSGSAVDRLILGTCNYIAPEHITSTLGSDIRSDIYSLGVVLYQLLSGRLPYEAHDLAELATRHRRTSPPRLRRLIPQIAPEVARLAEQMLAKNPLRRPQTPRELVKRLVALEISTFSERMVA
ncbi:MAG: serine/threonine-protein kinase [Thermoguttaceae bacterium]|jgi:serine/threonine protein kinase